MARGWQDRAAEMEDLACQMWGTPNSSLSIGSELRFGRKGSVSVDLVKSVWFDHGTGEGGGFVDLYRLVHGRRPSADWKSRRPVIPSDEAAVIAGKQCRARRIWDETRPAGGTIVERYLRSRGLDMPVPDDLRRHPKLFHDKTGTWWPAMVAGARDAAGQIVAVHRTFLHHINPGKAPVDPNKMSLGPVRGCAIRLAPAGPTLIVGEGIETTLSVMYATGLPAWAAINAGNMAKLHLPPVVREVTIAADGDQPGEDAAIRAALGWKRLGLVVRIMRPPSGYDFNDVLTGRIGQ